MAFFSTASSAPACTSLSFSGCFNGLCRPILVVLLYRCFKASVLRCLLSTINQ
jgi:hypothetical protein